MVSCDLTGSMEEHEHGWNALKGARPYNLDQLYDSQMTKS
jgi:hypothetical protein